MASDKRFLRWTCATLPIPRNCARRMRCSALSAASFRFLVSTVGDGGEDGEKAGGGRGGGCNGEDWFKVLFGSWEDCELSFVFLYRFKNDATFIFKLGAVDVWLESSLDVNVGVDAAGVEESFLSYFKNWRRKSF